MKREKRLGPKLEEFQHSMARERKTQKAVVSKVEGNQEGAASSEPRGRMCQDGGHAMSN